MPRLVFGGRGAIVFCILIIGLRFDFRLISHINARIVKRNLGQCDLVKALQGLGTRFCILGRILLAHRLIFHISPKLNIGTTLYPKMEPYKAHAKYKIRFNPSASFSRILAEAKSPRNADESHSGGSAMR